MDISYREVTQTQDTSEHEWSFVRYFPTLMILIFIKCRTFLIPCCDFIFRPKVDLRYLTHKQLTTVHNKEEINKFVVHTDEFVWTLSSSLQESCLHIGAIEDELMYQYGECVSDMSTCNMCCIWKYFGSLQFHICWAMFGWD